jgi:hypothetical protein
MKFAMNAPATPKSIVMMIPPGSLPGMRNLATAPMISPTTNVQIIKAPFLVLRSVEDFWFYYLQKTNHDFPCHFYVKPDDGGSKREGPPIKKASEVDQSKQINL